MTTPRPGAAGPRSTRYEVELREKMIAQLVELDVLRTEPVTRAFRAVPRHLFVPEAPLTMAYDPQFELVTKRDGQGVALSSVSPGRVQAVLLEAAAIAPGMRVLEIGSGGCTAALIAELVGGDGEVVTIDIDLDVVARARRLLPFAGYDHVLALLRDGLRGEPRYAPYDRIVVTAEVADLVPAWADQLGSDGRIVVPLHLGGLAWAVAFQRHAEHLVAREFAACRFAPMRGAGAWDCQRLALYDDGDVQVGMHFDQRQPVVTDALRHAFRRPQREAWSDVTVPSDVSSDELELWLLCRASVFAVLTTTRAGQECGLVAARPGRGTPTLVDVESNSFAYLTMRPTGLDRGEFEFGAVAHGRNAAAVADALVTEVQAWGRDHRGQHPELRAYPAGTPDKDMPPGRVLDRTLCRFAIAWPTAR